MYASIIRKKQQQIRLKQQYIKEQTEKNILLKQQQQKQEPREVYIEIPSNSEGIILVFQIDDPVIRNDQRSVIIIR